MKKLWLIICAYAVSAIAAPTLVTVSQTIYRADGAPARGTVSISWQSFDTAGGEHVQAGTKQVNLTSAGLLSVALAPNVGATPAGTRFTVKYNLDLGSPQTVSWIVPASGPVTVSSIQSTTLVGPSSIIALSQIGGVTNGGILFGQSGSPAQDSTKLFWDNTNKRLGIGTAIPVGLLHLTYGASPSAITIANASGGLILTSSTDGYNRIYFENLVSTTGRRVFRIGNEGGALDFSSASNNAGANVTGSILNLRYDGTVSMASMVGTGTRCIHANAFGELGPAATDCGSGGGGGANIAATTNTVKGDGAGNGVAVTGPGTDCVLVNGSSTPCGSGGGGITLPFTPSATSSTLSIVNGSPAVYGFNGVNTSVSAGTNTVVRLAGSTSETLLFGIGSDGHLKLIAPTNTFTCTPAGFPACDTITGSAFTDGIIPLGSVPMNSGAGSWTFSTTVTDLRAPLQDNPLTAGTGITITKSGATRTAAVDTTVIPLLSQADIFTEVSAPSAPAAGKQAGYMKAGSGWCAKDSSGTERCTGSGSSGATDVQYISVPVSSAEIKALNGTPKTLITAPGANKYIEIYSVTYIYNFVTTAYVAGSTNIFVEYANGSVTVEPLSGGLPASELTGGTTRIYGIPPNAPTGQALSNVVNQALILGNPGTNYTVGDGTLIIHITYRILPSNA